jgi:hypothetical protein
VRGWQRRRRARGVVAAMAGLMVLLLLVPALQVAA